MTHICSFSSHDIYLNNTYQNIGLNHGTYQNFLFICLLHCYNVPDTSMLSDIMFCAECSCAERHHVESCSAECCVLSVVVQNVTMLSVVLLNVVF
jgi:hypothetical protein